MGFANPEQERATTAPSSIDTVPSGSVLAIDMDFGSTTITVTGEWSWTTDPAASVTCGATAGSSWLTIASLADYLGFGWSTDAGSLTKLALGVDLGPTTVSATITGDMTEQTPGDARTLDLTAFPGSATVEWVIDIADLYPAVDKSVLTVSVGWASGREVMTAPWSQSGLWLQKRYTPSVRR